MARPKTSTIRVDTTERLLAAAELHFAREGYAETRLADVARDAGIRRSSLLYHFGSKEQLHDRVVQRAFEQLSGALEAGLGSGGTYPARVRAAVTRLLAFETTHPALAQIILRALIAPEGPDRARILAALRPIVDRMIAFVEDAGADYLAPGVTSGVAVTTVFFGHLLRSAVGPDSPGWFDRDATRALSEILLISGVPAHDRPRPDDRKQ